MTATVSPQEQLAKSKLRALAQGIRVWVLYPGSRYAVPSNSSDGTAYEVVVHSENQADVSCNCKAGMHGRACKHLAAVMMRLEVEAELQEAAEALNNRILEHNINAEESIPEGFESREEFEQAVADLF